MASENSELDKIEYDVNNAKREILAGENDQLPGGNSSSYSDLGTDQSSNNATSLDVPYLEENFPNNEKPDRKDSVLEANEINAAEYLHTASLTHVNAEFDSDSEDGFCLLRHSKSDETHGLKRQDMVSKKNIPVSCSFISPYCSAFRLDF